MLLTFVVRERNMVGVFEALSDEVETKTDVTNAKGAIEEVGAQLVALLLKQLNLVAQYRLYVCRVEAKIQKVGGLGSGFGDVVASNRRAEDWFGTH